MAPAHDWQRLSPVTLVYFLFKAIPHLSNMWPALVPILAGGEAVRGFFWSYGIYLIVTLLLVSALLSYWLFRYQLATDHIQIRSGVFSRRRLTLYFDRVQQADIAQPFYFRPFGLAILGLESAGSSQQEVDLPGLPLDQAENFKTRILAYRDAQQAAANVGITAVDSYSPGTATADGIAPSPDFELRLPWHEVARYGLMHNGLLLVFPLLAPLAESLGPYLEKQFLAIDGSTLYQNVVAMIGGNTLILLIFIGILAGVAGLIAIYATSATVALVRYWNYHLTRMDDQYQYRAGLLTLKTRGFRLHKLQLVTVRQGLVARWLKRFTLIISKAGNTQRQMQEQLRFLIPVLTNEHLHQLKQQLSLPSPQWQRIHPFYIIWTTCVYGTLFGLIAGGFLFASKYPLWLALLSFPLLGICAWRRWWCMGFFHDQQWLALKTGFIGQRIEWLPAVKIQTMDIVQPPWLRFMDLANFHIRGATDTLTLPCVPDHIARKLRDESLAIVANYRGRWM